MPVYPAAEDFLFHPGKNFRVEWYYTEAGEMPAKDYYLKLAEKDQNRLKYVVMFLTDRPFGANKLPELLYRVEDKENKIYVFKPHAHRFFNFMAEGNRIIMTNAYQKHSQKMSAGDKEKLATAAKYRQDYLRRVQGRTYYEHSN